MTSATPFFSIGITTYNRRELLKQTLSSIASQTFADFEAIVGNDYMHETLSSESLGIDDKRIRFINHPKNLGEMQNMNSLLEVSSGRYFTWLADDDLYAPAFLESVHSAITAHGFPQAVFTSYTRNASDLYSGGNSTRNPSIMSGAQFLEKYFSRKVVIAGCYGVFDREHLKRIGGIEQLGNGFSPYSDNLLAIKAGLFERVALISDPLVFLRIHEGSVSAVSNDLEAYRTAQADYLEKSAEILSHETLRGSFKSNFLSLLRWCVSDFSGVILRSGGSMDGQLALYFRFLKRNISYLKGSPGFWKAWAHALLVLALGVTRAKLTKGSAK